MQKKKNKVILSLELEQRKNIIFWASSLSMKGKIKYFTGHFEGPITKKEAFSCALAETIKHLKKDVEITLITQLGHKKSYFDYFYKNFSYDLKGSVIVNFEKGNTADLNKKIIEIKENFVPIKNCKIIEHEDFTEYIA